ncbi:MAG: isoleucine--tRNA ligase [Ruminococcaceae bacterium]|nr:isoleucine--tRNA ligase [Oscillospiraceae bacterium]
MVKPDFIQMEHEILDLWEREGFQKKLMKQNENGPIFRFLDGPITANNPMGVHHAWGRSIKDIMLRYKGMTGHSCHYRNGFDGQGLWVEVEVEKELGFVGKRDIEDYGMDKFTRKCVDRVKKFSGIITEQSKRLGQWMDWDNSYYTNSDENIEGIWHFLKVCNDRGWITTQNRPMPWCPRCGTSLSEHEMTGSHKEVTHTSVFVRVPMLERDFDLLVWTTTPWTLSANVALAVNPELTYVKILTDDSPRPLVLAKSSLGYIDGAKNVIETLTGADLVGLAYESIFPMLPVQEGVDHKVVPWDEVAADEGSGVVHIAPGCGAEDFELGRSLGLAEICPIDETGTFYANYDFLSGLTAADAAQPVFDKLRELGKLYKTMEFTHMYPVCWRCKSQVLFRLVEEWYIKTDEIRPQLIKAAEGVQWDPPYIGKRMMDWLNNMGDWNISRKRYYGLPLPFYVCPDCGKVHVIGSREELREKAIDPAKVDALPELHRPWIDEVKIRCDCGAEVSRITSVGDVWLDAGITPFSTNKYFSDRAYWEKQFPAHWVTEMREQVRLWFYSILFMSVTLTGRAPYERVLAYNTVVSEDGSRFSKTGFMIRFDEAAERMGADAIRYLYAGANVASDVRFGFNLGDEARRKMLGLWNIYTFFETYAEIDNPVIGAEPAYQNLTDRWLTARVNDFVATATEAYERYNTADTVRAFEQCVDDVSNWYVRINRRRFWKEGEDADKQEAYTALFYAIRKICGVMAPIIPFMTEYIWQNMVRKYQPDSCESVHLNGFPKVEAIDRDLLNATAAARDVIATALKLRNERQIKVRQPLSALYLHKSLESELAPYLAIIRDELNIKEILFVEDTSMLQDNYLQLNFKVAGRILKGDLQKVKGILDNLSADDMKAITAQQAAGGEVMIPGYENAVPADLFNVLSKTLPHIAAHTTDKVEELVAIDATITDALRAEGLYRDLLRNCQVLRREAGFRVDDRVVICVAANSAELTAVIDTYRADIERETLSTLAEAAEYVMEKAVEIGDDTVTLKIAK